MGKINFENPEKLSNELPDMQTHILNFFKKWNIKY